MRRKVAISACVAAGLAVAALGAVAAAPSVPHQKWEYRFVSVDPANLTIDDTANKLGMDGWELVSTTITPVPNGVDKGLLSFKRPR